MEKNRCDLTDWLQQRRVERGRGRVCEWGKWEKLNEWTGLGSTHCDKNRFHFNHSNHPGFKNTKPDALSNLCPGENPFKNPSLIVPSPCVVGTFAWDVGTLGCWDVGTLGHAICGTVLAGLLFPTGSFSQLLLWTSSTHKWKKWGSLIRIWRLVCTAWCLRVLAQQH